MGAGLDLIKLIVTFTSQELHLSNYSFWKLEKLKFYRFSKKDRLPVHHTSKL